LNRTKDMGGTEICRVCHHHGHHGRLIMDRPPFEPYALARRLRSGLPRAIAAGLRATYDRRIGG
jgi:hypothetical protein